MVLLLEGAPASEDIEFLEENANYFGSKASVSVLVSSEKDHFKAVLDELKSENEVDFLITPRLDSGDSEDEIKHILTTLATLPCPSLYVSTRGSSVDSASSNRTTTQDGEEMSELTDTTHQEREGNEESDEDEDDDVEKPRRRDKSSSSDTEETKSDESSATDVEKGKDE